MLKIHHKTLAGITTKKSYDTIDKNTFNQKALDNKNLVLFLLSKIGGENMRIGEILRDTQPEEYKMLNKNTKRKVNKHKEKLNEKDIKELMNNRSYRRKNGAIRQVR